MKSRVAEREENRIIEQKINNSETEKPFLGYRSRSIRVSKLVRNTLLVGLLGVIVGLLPCFFVAGFSVLLFCFDG